MYALAIFLPLLGAIIAGLGGRWIGDRGAQIVTCAGIIGALCVAVVIVIDVAFGAHRQTVFLTDWIFSGKLAIAWALRFDTLSAVMIFVVTAVSAMVHVYSVGYMSHDPSIPRFMSYLSLFTFFMLMLVTADNLVQLFFGWEGVGLASYLLIGFWYQKPSAYAAAIKAFLVNRVGDLAFVLGICAVFVLFDTVAFDAIFGDVTKHTESQMVFLGMEGHALTVIALLLFIGACGKSAQLGLHTWLPDAMEGPTPVSALIHAATMVTAGVFLVVRMSPLFEYAPLALNVVTVVGATTALFAATVGMTQHDIKRVIAYSTCSQLGYMFFAAGVSAYGAAMFHLFTHAFFKALLFLGAGSVIHALSGEQDMRRMGGIRSLIPATYILMWIGSLALAGIPPFAGYFSKDMILEAAWGAHTAVGNYAFWIGILVAFLTAFYSWRLLILAFHGLPRADKKTMDHVHESPAVMLLPLFVLAIGAVLAGWLGYSYFVGEKSAEFWNGSILILPEHEAMENAHHAPIWVKYLPLVAAVSGILMAYVFYQLRPTWPTRVATSLGAFYRFLYNKWYFDELYDAVFVRPAFFLAHGLWTKGDVAIIDGLGPNGVAALVRVLAKRTGALQTGYLYHYAFVMLIGVVGILSWYLIGHMK